MTKSSGPHTYDNDYRIIPSYNNEGNWYVQWRSNSICYWFFNGMGWETDYEHETAGGYTFITAIEYETEEQAERRIKELMFRDERRRNEHLQDEERKRKVKAWSKSTKPRKVPPFLHL